MLNAIGEGLWEMRSPSASGFLRLGSRMTVARLARGGLWLHSPIALDDGALAALQMLGPVQTIVAPSLTHARHIAACRRLFPQARILGAPGLPAKHARAMRKYFPDSPIVSMPGARALYDGVLGAAPELNYGTTFAQLPLGGIPRLNEVVFLHLPSHTLIVTDLLVNMHPPMTWGTRLLLLALGRVGEPCQTALFKLCVKDKAAFTASIDEILAWDFDRIVLSHGEIVATEGKAKLRCATDWLRRQ